MGSSYVGVSAAQPSRTKRTSQPDGTRVPSGWDNCTSLWHVAEADSCWRLLINGGRDWISPAYLPDQRATRPIDQLSVTVWLGRVRRGSEPRSPTPPAAHDRTPSTTITRAGPAAARQHLSQADPRPVEYGGFEYGGLPIEPVVLHQMNQLPIPRCTRREPALAVEVARRLDCAKHIGRQRLQCRSV